METRVSITALARSRHAAEDAIGRAFAEMDRLVLLLNRHAGSSAVSTLNAQGSLGDAPPELTQVLTEARRLHRLSGGAFDVTVQPLVDVLKETGRVATPEILALVDMSALSLDGRRIHMGKSGMGVTLDGIAKGYIVDRMAAVLSRFGIDRWLIDGGGDIRASGLRDDGLPWRIGVQDPDKRGPYPATAELRGGALATSGGYENYFNEDRSSHHIVEGRSGRSPVRIASATVHAPTTMIADALATAAFLMSPSRALHLIDGLPDCACLLLDSRGSRHESKRWRSISPPQH
jgi:thiamine biosynthesis lipoprotein